MTNKIFVFVKKRASENGNLEKSLFSQEKEDFPVFFSETI